MKQLTTFFAILALTGIAFFPAAAHADATNASDALDDLDVTMVVLDNVGALSAEISKMDGPDHDVGDDHDADVDERDESEHDQERDDHDDMHHEDESDREHDFEDAEHRGDFDHDDVLEEDELDDEDDFEDGEDVDTDEFHEDDEPHEGEGEGAHDEVVD